MEGGTPLRGRGLVKERKTLPRGKIPVFPPPSVSKAVCDGVVCMYDGVCVCV